MSVKCTYIYYVTTLFVCYVDVIEASTTDVSTKNGDIRGYVISINGSNVVGTKITNMKLFLGIPYAEPPIGDLRFSRPVPKSPWSPKSLDAFSISPSCLQRPGFLRTYSFSSTYSDYSEDCLYLNIYVPHSSANPNATYPVLFWIHGGAYQSGSGSEYDGSILAQEGIIFVTINYRIGALGFLSTDDNVAPGNYGLLDQLMALKWVKDNIASFHGNPDQITISGHSSGGGSTSLHMFSPLAKGLFHSMIPQSGCALSPWAIYRPPHNLSTYTTTLAQTVGCPTSDSVTMVTCLRAVDGNILANVYISGPPAIAAFAPRVDGYYIHDLPENLLEQGDYIHGVNMLTGFLPDEVSEDYVSLYCIPTRVINIGEYFSYIHINWEAIMLFGTSGQYIESETGIDQGLSRQHLEKLFYSKSRRYLKNADNMFRAMKCAYPPSGTDVFLNRDLLIDMNSDYGYVVPHIKLSEKLSTAGENVWLYTFDYRSANSLKKLWIGVPHAEELYYMYGAPFLNQSPCPGIHNVTCPVTWGNYQQWSDVDEQVSKNMMKLWADFVKLGHDNSNFRHWPQFSPGDKIMHVNTVTSSEHLVKSSGVRFWDSFNYLNLTEIIPDVCDTDSNILVG